MTAGMRNERTAALLGITLGVTFGVCFATGLLSHLIQQPPAWFTWPPRPAGLYRITQGAHVVTGFATIPILLAKLWVVAPRLWRWPPFRTPAEVVERLGIAPLVAGAVFLLVSGVLNVAAWYPWPFFFPAAHYWTAWVTVGALVAHVGAQAATTRRAIRRAEAVGPAPEARDRRAFLGSVAAGSAALFVATAGGTIAPLSRVSVLAQREPSTGPQGLPVNKTAAAARVEELAVDPAYRLRVSGRVDTPLALSLAELEDLPQHDATLPIACVEGWSRSARWSGVRVRGVLALAGAAQDADVVVESLQPKGLYRRSVLSPAHAGDRDTLLALHIAGEPLHIDHGFPLRLIGPNRPGVMQTKWVSRLVVR